MMRSFLTRLLNPVTRDVLLALCLLICLACATPLPLEKLREGMTAEAAQNNIAVVHTAPEPPNHGRM